MLHGPGFVHSGEAWHGWVLAEEFREPQDCLAVVVWDVWLACLLKPFLREAGHWLGYRAAGARHFSPRRSLASSSPLDGIR